MTQEEVKAEPQCLGCVRWQDDARQLLARLGDAQADARHHRDVHAVLLIECERLRKELATTAGLIEAVAERAMVKAKQGMP